MPHANLGATPLATSNIAPVPRGTPLRAGWYAAIRLVAGTAPMGGSP